ncbi:hypothetical protein LCGC14_1416040 [marine sediment metagenome]|uniref:Uncharacterized protein n=1 Tax=marine sediment metagenome TaxID=412755 RepID=A0A0F9M8B8_9ZZZZ
MKGYIYCKECGNKIGLLNDAEYCQKKEKGDLPTLCNGCLSKKINLDEAFYDIFELK